MTNIHLKVEPNDGQLIIRQGDALPLSYPENINISGKITNPYEYYDYRKSNISKLNSHITVSLRNMEILLAHNDTQKHDSHRILGKIKLNPDLTAFQINEEKYYTDSELIKKLRFAKRFFKDSAEYEKILNGLNNISYKLTKDVNKKDDFKGNTLNSLATSLNIESLPESFTLKMPLFDGFEPQEIKVLIRLGDMQGLKFWFESIEMAEMIVLQSEAIIQNEISKFNGELPVFYIQ